MTSDNKPDSNLYAIERTHMGASRTFYSVLRTGLANAGAGQYLDGSDPRLAAVQRNRMNKALVKGECDEQ